MIRTLSRLVYSSRSSLKGMAEECLAEVADILRASRANNPKAGLTGVLLFDGTSFLQALEGPIAQIERLHEKISCDRRHEDITLIDLVPIEVRDYDTWSMAFLDGTDTNYHALRRFLTKQPGLEECAASNPGSYPFAGAPCSSGPACHRGGGREL